MREMAAGALQTEPDHARCPFSRAFTPGFRECGAFTPVEFVPLDTHYRPLAPVLTCRHLEIGDDGSGGFYPRCALGSAQSRQAWVATVGSERLERLRTLSLEYREWVRPKLSALWEKKAPMLAAGSASAVAGALKRELDAAVAELIEAAHTWIAAHGESLVQAGLEPELLRDLVDTSTQAWVETSLAGVDYRIPDDLLGQFPKPVQTFIRAGR